MTDDVRLLANICDSVVSLLRLFRRLMGTICEDSSSDEPVSVCSTIASINLFIEHKQLDTQVLYSNRLGQTWLQKSSVKKRRKRIIVRVEQ